MEPLEELDFDWLELNSNRQLLFNYLTVCSIARGWYPTPSEVYLSESRRRLGSAINDRGVPGVMTEFVQRETTLYEANVCEKQSRADRNRDEVQNILREARAQRNNETLANAATVLITRKGLDAFELVIEQLSKFYKTSVKVTVETIQYEPDSAYKATQEEWTGIEGILSVIQSEFE